MTPTTELERLIHEREQSRQKKIERLLTLWRDPELASVVELLRDGRSGSTKESYVPPNPSESIREAILGLSGILPKRFTARLILEALEESYFKFKANSPIGAVRDAVSALNKDGKLKMVEKAKGETPNTYEWA